VLILNDLEKVFGIEKSRLVGEVVTARDERMAGILEGTASVQT
jgi:hypothetical protein